MDWDFPAGRGQVTPRSEQTSFSTELIVIGPRRISKVRVAPSVMSTVGVASTFMVRVDPGTTGSSEKATALMPRPSVLPEH